MLSFLLKRLNNFLMGDFFLLFPLRLPVLRKIKHVCL
uniref:Uncharacterized protein n=1 Tax=Anguilla anguilla TaxID=7936 RepID=A0A0E9UC21_ANGAN